MSIPLARSLRAPVAVAAGLFAGCESLKPDAPAEAAGPPPAAVATAPEPKAHPAPGRHATRRGYYVFYHDFAIDQYDPLFAELDALPDQVYGELRLPPSSTVVQVFLFETQERYERYLKSSPATRHLPNRRAYFLEDPGVGGQRELKVLTWMGDHLRTDLRHELTHALLHGVLKDVPLWLDEGLAGFFELPPATGGVNAQHLEMIRRGPFHPDLGRLERFDQVRQMEKPEYREAWAWVHLMMRGPADGKAALQEYLQSLRTNPAPGPIQPKLKDALGDPERALVEHLAGMDFPTR